ncbi:DNA repair and recombination protein Rad51 [Aureococcus anophagefferens]|uniref:DNA repair and recombination protein Rad51 n=1 Tax=Aureococcus anophagefferens TaxID=44056 RepID=A0ABR1FXH1_AURAN
MDRQPATGAAPSASVLEGTYNQTYLIRTVDKGGSEAKGGSDDDDDDDDYQERRVLFRCGNWCYTGNVTLDKAKVLLSDLPRIIPTLQRQQNRLHFYCNASNVPSESSFKEPMGFVGDASEFAAAELASARVHEELRKWTDIYTWMETDAANTYFELQCAPPPCMDGIALAASKTYARGLVFITVYFEKAFYVVVQDGEGDQPLLDVKFPDVSQPGQGIHVANYAGDRTWLKLALWHSLAAENAPTRSSPTPAQSPKTTNLATDSYIQMYTVLKATEERGAAARNNAHHDVLFRFGSWCYSGSVQLTPMLDLADLPHLIPALRMQQSRLDFMCDVSAMPMNSPFARPMSYFSKVAPVLERELVAAEAVLAKLLQQLAQFEVGGSVASWLEGDSTQSFFEFQLALDKDLERVFKNVELLASKCYNPNGVVLIAIYFLGTFYVALGDSAGEQPLLDSRFPDVSSKGRGYLIASYAEGTPAWPQLRKVSIWQTASAMAAELEARGAKASDAEPSRGPAAVEAGTKGKVHPLLSREHVAEEGAAMHREDGGATTRVDLGGRGGADAKAPAPSSAAQAKGVASSDPENERPAAKGDDDPEPDAKAAPAAAPEETKEQRDARIEALLTAQPKKKPSGLAPLSPLGSKVNAPHRVPAMAGGAALNEKLAKMRAELGTLGKEAPWDEFGRPKALAFKK